MGSLRNRYLTVFTIVLSVFEGLNGEVCVKKDCLTTAANLLENINNSVNPCDDFYEYSCGLFHENTFINWRKPIVTSMNIRYDQYLSELRLLLHAPKNFTESESVWKAKDFYSACMISDTVDKLKAVKYFIKNTLGGWPLIEGIFWNSENFNWIDIIAYLSGSGFKNTGIFDISVQNHKILLPYQLTVDFGSPALWTVLNQYNNLSFEDKSNMTLLLIKVVKFFKSEDEGGKIRQSEVQDVVDFMQQIHEWMKLPNDLEQNLSLSQLISVVPRINWKSLFIKLIKRDVTEFDYIYVENYFKLKSIVDLVESTDKRIIANYIIFNLLASLYLHDNLFDDYVTKLKTFLTLETALESDEPKIKRVIQCVEHASQLSHVARSMHFKKYFTARDKIVIRSIEDLIAETFVEFVRNADGIDDVMKIDIIKSLSRENEYFTNIIGTDDSYSDDDILDKEYASLASHPYDHFMNLLFIKRFRANLEFRNIGSYLDGHRRKMVTTILKKPTVYYEGSEISGITFLEIPSSLMRGITFSRERSISFNYGILGYSIAKSLISYVTSNIIDENLEDWQFLMDLIGNNCTRIEVEKENKVLKEIFLDQLSIRISYLAYKNWSLEHGSDVSLPGLKHSTEQLFWLGYATAHCTAYEKDLLPNFVPGRKVLNVLSDIEQFAIDFQCPIQTRTNCKFL